LEEAASAHFVPFWRI